MISIQSLAELTSLIRQVRQANKALGTVNIAEVLQLIVQTVSDERNTILEANTLDLEASLEMAVPSLILEWLKLTPERLSASLAVVERLRLTQPYLHGYPLAAEPTASRHTHRYSLNAPLGVVALVYEALPELAIVAAALCLSTGNSLILKGGHEASQTNQAIADVLQKVLVKANLPEYTILAISPSEGEAARRWLTQTPDLDLLIPYGRAGLVQKVVREAHSPALSTAIGNCYLYWGNTAPAELVAQMVIDSYKGDPEPVNCIEKVLVNAKVPPNTLSEFHHRLERASLTVQECACPPEGIKTVDDAELWYQARLNHTIISSRVPNLAAAVAIINECSYQHACCIASNTYSETMQFVGEVQSATTYINTSPRFQRNAAQPNEIALGMSPQKRASNGRITAANLTRCKTIVNGLETT
ncbi:MAG: gamma-glutamyl-phosphate reductase [Cyanobacteria bacterium J06638_28]